MKFIVALGLALTLGFRVHAESSEVAAPSNSLVSGAFVKLQETRPYGPVIPACETETISVGKTEVTREYVENIFSIITQSNPSVFANEYAPDQFCLDVRNSGTPTLTAGNRADGRITLDSFGNLFANDAEFAFALAHELAHVVLQHSSTDLIVTHPGLKNARLDELKRKYFEAVLQRTQGTLTVLKDISSGRTASSEEDSEALSYAIQFFSGQKQMALTQLGQAVTDEKLERTSPGSPILEALPWDEIAARSEVLLGPNSLALSSELVHSFRDQVSNLTEKGVAYPESGMWQEIEADLVGLRIFIRAGFDPNEVVKLFLRWAGDTKGDPEERCVNSESAPSYDFNDDDPYRTHPGDCWRAWRLSREIKHLRTDGWDIGDTIDIEKGRYNLDDVLAEQKASER